MKNSARLHIIVHGDVQGVFFRHEAKETAERLGLFGLVKNLQNGDVEIIAEGKKEDLEVLEVWSRAGSIHAKVTHRETSWANPTGEFSSFRME